MPLDADHEPPPSLLQWAASKSGGIARVLDRPWYWCGEEEIRKASGKCYTLCGTQLVELRRVVTKDPASVLYIGECGAAILWCYRNK